MSLMIVKSTAGEALFLNDQVIVEYWGKDLAYGATTFMGKLSENLSLATGLTVETYDVGTLEPCDEEGQGAATLLAKAKDMQSDNRKPLGTTEALAALKQDAGLTLRLAEVGLFDLRNADQREPFKTVNVLVATASKEEAETLALKLAKEAIQVHSGVRFIVRGEALSMPHELFEAA